MLSLAAHLKAQLSPCHAMWGPDCPQDMEYAPKPCRKTTNSILQWSLLLSCWFVDWAALDTNRFCGHTVTDQPGWPESTTPALSSDLQEEALPHFTERLFAMTGPTGLIPILWKTLICSEVLPTANLYNIISEAVNNLSLIGKMHFCSTVLSVTEHNQNPTCTVFLDLYQTDK